ncbi:hypothetical protein BDP27DRAFT_1424755 [Rhodocollybia butyracea]|uniref:Uncharacterized protein n=1 Tax=Rhodocollybia butyracea TaxID=206335 RepID=A0A9P5U593_9AGAR|nr:hypothetical protein BDP27DRAFT_1424755 [Rhodocollybia butyracea]
MAQDKHADYVKRYNALPRKALAPSGRVPNVWHFDLRYIPISPPSHTLFIVQKESHFIANEVLPLGKKPSDAGLSYFPETAKEASHEICLGLMHAFLTMFTEEIPGSTTDGLKTSPNALAPWKLTTDDRSLAQAVEEQFKALGVNPDRCKVECVNLVSFAQVEFDNFYQGLKGMLGVSDFVKATLVTPQCIGFSNAIPPDPKAWSRSGPSSGHDDEEMSGVNSILGYIHEFMNNEPLPVNEDGAAGGSTHLSSRIQQSFGHIKTMLETTTLKDVCKKADRGDAQQAVDAALRLKLGCGCTPDRVLSRKYLIQAALDEKASSQTRSMAHSMLITWYLLGYTDLRARFLFAAAYHADESIRLASGDSNLTGVITVVKKPIGKPTSLSADPEHRVPLSPRRLLPRELAKMGLFAFQFNMKMMGDLMAGRPQNGKNSSLRTEIFQI